MKGKNEYKSNVIPLTPEQKEMLKEVMEKNEGCTSIPREKSSHSKKH